MKEKLNSELNLHHTLLDLERKQRNGFAEIIYGESKSSEQLADIFENMQGYSNVLATRVSADAAKYVQKRCPDSEYYPSGKILRWLGKPITYCTGKVGIVTAGTSDLAVAEETRLVCETIGCHTELFCDVGVAGLHRLLTRIDAIREMQVVIVLAGMEGALASVIGGLVAMPVIALPTSVGYGANFAGVSALLGMLTSCASGITVVNIDNGVGAACAAYRICSTK